MTCSAVVSTVVMVMLVIIEYHFTLRMIIIGAITALCSITAYTGGSIAKKIMLGEWLDMADFFRRITEYEGTHYIGRIFYIVISVYILWNIIMCSDKNFEKSSFNKGTFDKKGFIRLMGILSIHMIIQTFLGRMGCLSAGCCIGKPYTGFLSVRVVTTQYTVYPAVYVELIGMIITLVLTVNAYLKRKNAFKTFGIGYSVSVFTAEFMYDQTGHIMICNLSAVQILALVLVLISCFSGEKQIHKLSDRRKRSVDK